MDQNFNPDKQHTLSKSISIKGTGLHTGILVEMNLKPANPGFGIQFQRTDLPGQPIIKADCDLVTDTSRGTTLQFGDAKVSTVEHILAALVGLGIDNVLIEINGPEIPIMDGSSAPFITFIEEAGIAEQDAAKAWYSIDENIYLYDEKKRVEMVAMPAIDYQITTLIDFNSPVLGTQHAGLKTIKDFKTEIAPCRTFVFLHELEMLLDNNLIKGGDINNAIVVVDKPLTDGEMERLAKTFKREKIEVKSEGYLNNLELRFPNEPARHKLLDVVGDLALIGYPIKARIIANRPGHSTNVEFAKKIKQYIKKNKHVKDVPVYNPAAPSIFNLQRIEKTLPHRFPFLLVDKIIELTDTHIVGVKNVTFNEWFFQGHFPNNPVMPGVLQIEALAQTGGILCINTLPEGDYDTYFLKIDNCKFKQKVLPGDTMILKMEFISPIRRGICEMKGMVYVGGKVATEANLVAQLVKRN
ncbi:MAG: bifunctional UDP-3-O-[3-hydroxymyristoyl] N-acetylglucosamine deacetylase/3-hydroxyacyl-ACP dehydratase [Hydrotalea flava]|uniref:bifunctional UDP-3-O-[3-hydroxymyristoyl] N-acetylglucosamine deacetylase/3-hydroxyacyl-ACP dehydratase n=1 Tax=Hydrotalea TaxID=1004300 RepID=UPI0009429E7A|nr:MULTISPECIES: bifunctional UDP-3-O-[3-hydroxymyristoyl] N-acetylglucosamine deacetylase/3-hydroxyacyl-ACP dehydratase [Hydrotalea]MBY0348228.1 bifunctional UDP-3-O-[3-hydroxymyristoyl] N-acetylglucosamine deacetylase/3-hydroxyacyl-ACP dehydratase [Hydrotalea flava]NIM34301.1 bifunctional UDP-3-O-[3-hydroxymyristoyl] N-acetylglucosamine deacetylase/3-hydroxyacyl-ACP dehydratase [Hydrotalea flava]NIM37127.1 bifunctional UDP-3-O-[3-hydroxymyristoyl] N-acetylglucosamine deacetylase/3-hydroxyacyl-